MESDIRPISIDDVRRIEAYDTDGYPNTNEAALNIRHMDRNARERLSRGAKARGMTLAQYVEALVDLHDDCRHLADAGDIVFQGLLASKRLESVTA